MARALELAALGAGTTNPNPMVGCVVVRAGRVVGEGHHVRAGGAHAEPIALARAGAASRGATAYVNLEPCAHQGRTVPCAPLLAAAGVRRVVAAIGDPDPRVNGRGLALLRRAGIDVETGVLADEARLLNQRFLVAARSDRPFVLLKAATTLDGRIATATGDSKWITSAAQRRAARRMRGLHDAVAVGIGTVLADDPLLLPSPRPKRPFRRIVFDSRLRLPVASQLVATARQSPVIVLTRRSRGRRVAELRDRGVIVVSHQGAGRRVPLAWGLGALLARGVTSLMVEGGSELLGSFADECRFDQLALFRAPLLLGGRGSLAAFGGPNPMRIGEAVALSRRSPQVGRNGPAGDPLLPADCDVWYLKRRASRRATMRGR